MLQFARLAYAFACFALLTALLSLLFGQLYAESGRTAVTIMALPFSIILGLRCYARPDLGARLQRLLAGNGLARGLFPLLGLGAIGLLLLLNRSGDHPPLLSTVWAMVAAQSLLLLLARVLLQRASR